LLGNFNANLGKEDIFKPTLGNESLREINEDNGVKVKKFATSTIWWWQKFERDWQ
jgi:hypothetical protein